MPTFEDHESTQAVRMLYIGDSGAGKTGSLASLVTAGFTVRILDLDKGVDILEDYMKNEQSIYGRVSPGLWTQEQAKSRIKRLSYVTITEPSGIKGGQWLPKAKAWQQMNNQLDKWKDGTEDLGSIATWDRAIILVVDGLSRVCDFAMNFQLSMNARLGQTPQQADWFLAQGMVERFIKMLTSDEIKCNLILVCHIAFIETDSGPTKGFPQTLGKALSPKIAQSFNHVLMARSTGSGLNVKRQIFTGTHGMIELKNTAPLRVKAEYPLETGLAEYFRDLKKGPGAAATTVAAPVPGTQALA
jgi:hypothetical protein